MTACSHFCCFCIQMTRHILIILLTSLLANAVKAQNLEVARYEITLPITTKTQQCDYAMLDSIGILTVAETGASDTKGTKIWNFTVLDTNLVEQSSFNTSLDAALQLNSTTASDNYAASVFTTAKRTDSTKVCVVIYDRNEDTISGFTTALPPNITMLPAVAARHTLMLAYNSNNGGSSISFYDMKTGETRRKHPQNENSLIQNVEALQDANRFVVTTKEFENKHSIATNFLIFDTNGNMRKGYSYPNDNGATIGRSCSMASDSSFKIFATIERIGNTKTSAKGFADSYDKESIGIAWIDFSGERVKSKFYQFKNIPDIDKALTPNNRLRVKQRQVSQTDTASAKRSEIAFQLLKPNLICNNDTCIMALEAFMPIYHTETRMAYGYFSSIPTTYTVFDGYDFYAQLVFAFNSKGEMLWYNHCNYDNPVDETLCRHTSEAVCNSETVLLSTNYNELTYSIISSNGTKIADNETTKLPLMGKNDILESESSSITRQWYGSNFIVTGKQVVKDRRIRRSSHLVFFLQKIQYE